MNRNIALLILFCASLFVAIQSAAAAIIDSVPIGNAGNANDPADGDFFTSGVQHYGAVAYEYRIGTYEVTNDQYTGFLNAVALTDSFGLFNPSMGSNARGGITRSGADGSFTYATKTNMGNKPVNFVSWYDAIRFTNWLHNNQPSGVQGNGTTDTGAYTLLGATPVPSNGNTVTRNVGANWFLPNENEWYKAAYHKNDGVTGNYWSFATGTNAQPTPALANVTGDISNPGVNVVNYRRGAVWNGQADGNLTTVGSAGAGSAGPYLTFDQAGNLSEWNETLVFGTSRGFRGDAWNNTDAGLPWGRFGFDPSSEVDTTGFRVASVSTVVPEPACVCLFAAGVLTILLSQPRLRH